MKCHECGVYEQHSVKSDLSEVQGDGVGGVSGVGGCGVGQSYACGRACAGEVSRRKAVRPHPIRSGVLNPTSRFTSNYIGEPTTSIP